MWYSGDMGKWPDVFVVLFVLIVIVLVNIIVELDLWLRILSVAACIADIYLLFRR
jgi:hypothetical protein